jgi:transposase, IS30 family
LQRLDEEEVMALSDELANRPGLARYSASQRELFFRLLDRGGTIRAAAAGAGVSPDTGYQWRRQAGVASRRPRPRTYTAEEKAEFFRLLSIRGNVSAVARELGYVRVTCYKWAHQAGIFTGKDVSDQRAEFLRLRGEGVSRRDAAAGVGVDKRTAQDWDKGIRQFYGGRVYPDGRVVKYRPAEILANVKNPRNRHGDNDTQNGLERLERSISPRYLSLTEREQIHDLKTRGLSIRQIGHRLGRSPSTISRELHRNATQALGYLPYSAHRMAAVRRERPKERKLERAGRLRQYVGQGLRRRWSPEQISRRLVKDFPGDLEMRVGTEAIYQSIYLHGRGALKREIVSAIRSGRVTRKPRRDPTQRTPRFREAMISIVDRPAEVEDRAIPGHWEGDLIVGAVGRSAIGTVVERASRYVVLVHLPAERTAEAVRDGLIRSLGELPQALRRSLTWDQGAEMSEHHAFWMATDMRVYFCDPGAPWQRGTNENTNGLLRQYFPKGTDLSRHSVADLAAVAEQLNTRPRKTLSWDTPAERLTALLEHG